MNFPTPEQAANIRKAKASLEKNLNDKIAILGPYEKRVNHWYVSGGCMASLLRGEEPNDYDIYFKNYSTLEHVKALITGSPDLKQHIKDVEEKYRDVVGVDGKCITENAITMKNGLQFITKHWGDHIRDTFDFVHCMPMYDFSMHRLYISEEQYDCCVNKILKVNMQENVTDKRIDKFMKQGYRFTEVVEAVEKDDIIAEEDWMSQLFGGKK